MALPPPLSGRWVACERRLVPAVPPTKAELRFLLRDTATGTLIATLVAGLHEIPIGGSIGVTATRRGKKTATTEE